MESARAKTAGRCDVGLSVASPGRGRDRWMKSMRRGEVNALGKAAAIIGPVEEAGCDTCTARRPATRLGASSYHPARAFGQSLDQEGGHGCEVDFAKKALES